MLSFEAAAMDDSDADDAELVGLMRAYRPDVDPLVRSVLRNAAQRALFGAAEPVRIGRYQILRPLGAGGGGSVFVARDPELGREVALKVVRAGTAARRARAVAEGQALAQLAHPNVVPIFDVGADDDRVYLVMELVRGASLRRLAERAGGASAVVGAYRQAGAGLAAAHAAGLIHRDFKPDNAVLGADGRVRVVDFGLAAVAGDVTARAGGVGTPAYMAPEQRHGEPVTAACDQYAFAVALREGVGEPVPRWLLPIVGRGAASNPAARFPSMAALLAALADDPARRWRRRALVALPVALVAAGFVVGHGREPALPACDGATALAPAWTVERSAGMAAHLLGLKTPFAVAEAPRLRAAIDDYAARWRERYDAGCQARRGGALTPALFERRLACLASARNRLDATVALVGGSDGDGVAPAARAVASLPELAVCDDLDIRVEPPPPASAVAVAAVTADLDRTEVAVAAARVEARSASADAVARARDLGYRPLLARALLLQGRAELALGERASATAPLAEAAPLALAISDDATAAEAIAQEVWASSGTAQGRARALAGLGVADALAERLGPAGRFARALLHGNAGTVLLTDDHPEAARAELRRALTLARDVTGDRAIELARVRVTLAIASDDAGERQRLFAEALAEDRARLGAEHPATLETRITEAFHEPDAARALALLLEPCRAFVALHPGRRVSIVECAGELALLELAAGRSADAERDLIALLAAVEPGKLEAKVAFGRALALLFSEGPTASARALAAIAAGLPTGPETSWWRLAHAAEVEVARALVAAELGDAAGRAAALERATGHLERAAKAHPDGLVARWLAWVRERSD